VGHALLILVCGATTTFASGNYTARRFDVYATVQNGGALDVRETVEFEFQTGTMSKVWREIPVSRTDGIDIIDASMDGRAVEPDIRRGTRLRVEWQFPPTGPSTHTFVLHYIVHGMIYREGDRDVLRWRALPIEHAYAIDATRITVHASEPDADPPKAEAHRAALSYARAIPAGGVDIAAGPIRPNGWILADVRFGGGRIATAPPQWQQRQESTAALAPRWAMAGGAVFVLGLVILVIVRQAYPAPSIRPDETATTDQPADIPAAIAAVLAANGRYVHFAAQTTLIDLADRGVLTIREVSRRLGARTFEVSQVPGTHDLEEHETTAIMIAFGGGSEPVTLNKARARLAGNAGRVRHALTRDLTEGGYIDPTRKAARDRVTAIGVACLLLTVLACAGAAAFVSAFGAWTFLAPAGLGLAGIVGVIMAASMTPLSDAALVEAARWRGYRRHLKSVAADPDLQAPQGIPSRWIIYAVALGLAYQWARYLKKHPEVAPRWCVPLQDDGGAFAALIGSHAATSGHGAGAGAGAAAGGGSSGAA
jgi:hypothetical protein